MNIKEYDYEEFTEKDMFEVKLKDIIPKFGYMTCTKRNKFFEFCVSRGFIECVGKVKKENKYGYRVLVAFMYSTMAKYRPSDVSCSPGEIIIVDNAFRPRTKLNGSFSSNWEGMKPAKLSDFDDA